MDPFSRLGPFASGENEIQVVIDTPRGSRNKFKWDDQLGIFRLSHVLSAGAAFPFDYGFVPRTRSEDGDAVDVLVLTDEPLFTGCMIFGRLVGVIEAEQTQHKETFRNDRLIAVATESRRFGRVVRSEDLRPQLLDEIEQFFVSYNAMRERIFRPIARSGRERAIELVKEGARRFEEDR